jgi:hypothetical protein
MLTTLSTLRVCLVQKRGRGGEGRNFNEGGGREGKGRGGEIFNYLYVWFKRGEGREEILITNVFGSRGEGRDDKTKLFFYPYNLIKVS